MNNKTEMNEMHRNSGMWIWIWMAKANKWIIELTK